MRIGAQSESIWRCAHGPFNRIPSLTSGKADIVISSFSITPERAKTIAFSNCVFVDQQVAIGPKAVVLGDLAAMKGKHVGVTRSTTNDVAGPGACPRAPRSNVTMMMRGPRRR